MQKKQQEIKRSKNEDIQYLSYKKQIKTYSTINMKNQTILSGKTFSQKKPEQSKKQKQFKEINLFHQNFPYIQQQNKEDQSSNSDQQKLSEQQFKHRVNAIPVTRIIPHAPQIPPKLQKSRSDERKEQKSWPKYVINID